MKLTIMEKEINIRLKKLWRADDVVDDHYEFMRRFVKRVGRGRATPQEVRLFAIYRGYVEDTDRFAHFDENEKNGEAVKILDDLTDKDIHLN